MSERGRTGTERSTTSTGGEKAGRSPKAGEQGSPAENEKLKAIRWSTVTGDHWTSGFSHYRADILLTEDGKYIVRITDLMHDGPDEKVVEDLCSTRVMAEYWAKHMISELLWPSEKVPAYERVRKPGRKEVTQ